MSIAVGFLYLTARLAAILTVAPLLGHKAVGMAMRLGLAFLMALAIAPVALPHFVTSNSGSISAPVILSQCLGEILVGTAIGLGILIIFSVAMMIGSTISHMSGLQLESVFANDDSFGQHPTTQLIGLTAAAVFVLSGGLELGLSTAIDSFAALPIGESISGKSGVKMITSILQQSFELTIRAVAPAIAALIVSTILIGMVSRSLPQLNLVQVGLSTNIGLMLAATFLTLGGCVWLVIDDVERVIEVINHSLGTFKAPLEP